MANPLEIFHPLVRRWFHDSLGEPTEIQAMAWSEIAAGKHVLVTAPTGSGKTLTAFLWAINKLLTGKGGDPARRVLYISPLKALNNDIRRNLTEPLFQLRAYFREAGESFPEISVAVRSGDTDPSERRRMTKYPPLIFITTPESLNVILSSKTSRGLLSGVSTVILDEIHAVAPTKRGTYLMAAIERMVPMCGEFQRIALSATVKPMELIADFIAGYMVRGNAGDCQYRKRDVEIIQSTMKKQYSIEVHYPERSPDPGRGDEWWMSISESLKERIRENRSTLLFANSRRTVEKISRLINENENEPVVYAHHGSLAKEIRTVVEQRLKNGELRAIVATGSLELGIDIGQVDEVILLETPYSVSSAIQRIGRSGHRVGEISRGGFFPLHMRHLLGAAILAADIESGDIEPLKPLENPLDVLAQVILSMVLYEKRDIDRLYGEIRAVSSFHNLSRREFDLVLDMLAGRYADSRLRELKPRIILDRIENTIIAREHMQTLLLLSGGVIPDSGYFVMRDVETGSKIGELDEEFVWERSVGDSFPFGNQVWQITAITHNDVAVRRTARSNSVVPFWKAEEMNRSFHLSEKIGYFLEKAEDRFGQDEFKDELMTRYHLSETAAAQLVDYLGRQTRAAGGLPHRHHILVEHLDGPGNSPDCRQVILHTMWGGRVNRPFAFALSAAWEEKFHYALEVFANNDCILLNLSHESGVEDILSLVNGLSVVRYLRQKLESTGYFGARFRENAQRALLLPRRGFHERQPRWIYRLRSKKLLDAVSGYSDFPIVLETWRTCLSYDFDLETLDRLLNEIKTGEIRISFAATKTPSPFADEIVWRQTNYYLYADDTPGSKLRTNLSDDLLGEMLASSHLRPRLPASLICSFVEKIQRTAPGYAPPTAEELLEHVKERLLISGNEWDSLLSAIEREHGIDRGDMTGPVMQKLHFEKMPGGPSGVVALENLERYRRFLRTPGGMVPTVRDSAAGFLGEWLRFYGPVSRAFIRGSLGMDEHALAQALAMLFDEQIIIIDEFRLPADMPSGEPVPEEICDSENLEIMLRMHRAAARPVLEPVEITRLPLFLAAFQGLAPSGEGMEGLQISIERLLGYPAPAGFWESEILPARIGSYTPALLDAAMRESELMWFGCGNKEISFCFKTEFELYSGYPGEPAQSSRQQSGDSGHQNIDEIHGVLASTPGKISLTELAGATGKSVSELSGALWRLAWEGLVSNDDFASVRKGILSRFMPEPISKNSIPGRPMRFSRWKNTRTFCGNWFALGKNHREEPDALEKTDIARERIRQLLARYGIIFRDLLRNELPLFQWSTVFRTLRLMEFSGEVFTGYFFKDIPGLQFCSHEGLRILNGGLPDEAIYWMNAQDPASLCGSGIPKLDGLPARLSTTHIVYHGAKPVLISRRNGKLLDFKDPDSDPHLVEYISFFKTLLSREFNPLRLIRVDSINGEPALRSPYRSALLDAGFRLDHRSLVLRKTY